MYIEYCVGLDRTLYSGCTLKLV